MRFCHAVPMPGHILGLLLMSLLILAPVARADDDTLRDLGTNAAPREIPKWDGSQWRNAHVPAARGFTPTSHAVLPS